jgi:hypothetical protein
LIRSRLRWINIMFHDGNDKSPVACGMFVRELYGKGSAELTLNFQLVDYATRYQWNNLARSHKWPT